MRRAERGSARNRDREVSERGHDARLRPWERLSRNSEFQRVYREGTSFPGTLLVLFVLSGSDLRRRVGFVAGRRVGNAVARNRAKRLMREAYRDQKHAIPAEGFHVVLVARKAASASSLERVRTDLLTLFSRAGFRPPDQDQVKQRP